MPSVEALTATPMQSRLEGCGTIAMTKIPQPRTCRARMVPAMPATWRHSRGLSPWRTAVNRAATATTARPPCVYPPGLQSVVQDASWMQQPLAGICLGEAESKAAVYSSGMANTVDELVAQLREGGARVTTARRLVLTALVQGARHLTAEELLGIVRAMAPDVHAS